MWPVCISLFSKPEAQLIIPDWRGKVDDGIGSVSLQVDWRAGTTTLYHSQLYPPVSDCEFGYSAKQHGPLEMYPKNSQQEDLTPSRRFLLLLFGEF